MRSSLSSLSATGPLSSSDSFGNRNICFALTRRSQGFHTKDAGVAYRKNMGILRKLICQESTTFRNVWTTHSTSPIGFQCGRIFFDNYQCCVNSTSPKPRIIYRMPPWPKSEKIEDALLIEFPVGELLPRPSDYKPSILVVTANNWLFRLSASTGEILEKVYLASHCKFRYLSWDNPQEIVVVKSAQSKLSAAARQAGMQPSVLLFLAVFRVMPLSFIGMLGLDKKIFGNGMSDAAVSANVLVVTYSAGLVRLYNFQAICEQFTECHVDLEEECSWNGKTGIVGRFPFGIPCNIKITDTPDLLFEVSSLENTFQIGGYPWHYIFTPNKKKQQGIFHVCSLKDKTLAKNGIQNMECSSLEPDWISFHPDTSGRLLHVGPSLIKVLKLKASENDVEQKEVMEDFVIEANRRENVKNSVTVTASGRVVKKRLNILDDDPEQETFKIVDYEDELNLMSVVAVTQIGAEGTAHLDLHCNEYGTRLKSIPFLESWDVTYSHEVYFDRDTIVHIEEKPSRIFSCYVYQMIRSSSQEDEVIKKGKGERLFCEKIGKTFEVFL